MTETLASVRDQAQDRLDGAKKSEKKKLRALADGSESLRATLVSTNKAGWLSGDEKLRENLGNLFGSVSTYDGRPTGSQLAEKDRLLAQLQTAEKDVRGLIEGDLASANRALERRGVDPISIQAEDEWMAKNSGTGASAAVLLTNKHSRVWLRNQLLRLDWVF